MLKRQKVLWSTTVLIILALPALAWVAPRTRTKDSSAAKELSAKPYGRRAKAAVARNPASPPIGDSEDQKLEVEVITIRSGGFEPDEIVRPHGRFMLAIKNQTGESELSLYLDRLAGNRFHEVRMPKGRIRWNPRLNLPQGDYVLREQNHPEWVCRIRLTSK